MKLIKKAQKLLAMYPPPADLEAQIDALYEKAEGEEKERFAQIYEALFVIMNR